MYIRMRLIVFSGLLIISCATVVIKYEDYLTSFVSDVLHSIKVILLDSIVETDTLHVKSRCLDGNSEDNHRKDKWFQNMWMNLTCQIGQSKSQYSDAFTAGRIFEMQPL